VSLCERKKELKRRRHRKKRLAHLAQRLRKATVSEKSVIVDKIRRLTPGCETILDQWGLQKR
jgi:hypothetical protein